MKLLKGNSKTMRTVFSLRTIIVFTAVMFTSTLLFGDWVVESDGSHDAVYTSDDGKVGIGTNSPIGKLDVVLESGERGIEIYGRGNSHIPDASGNILLTTDISTGIGNFRFRSWNVGNVYTELLTIKGLTGNAIFNGIISCPGYSCSSDLRFKHNIRPVGHALQKVTLLTGVTYDWKKDEFKDRNFSSGRQIGLIAQDVEKVLPELVTTGEDGYKSIQYNKLTAVLVEAMKEMNAKTVALEKENASLRKRLASLEKMSERIAQLEKRLENRVSVR